MQRSKRDDTFIADISEKATLLSALKQHLYRVHVLENYRALSADEQEKECALRFHWLFASHEIFFGYEEVDKAWFEMFPQFWHQKALEDALDGLEDPFAMLAVANGLVHQSYALDYDWTLIGIATLRALLNYAHAFPSSIKRRLWSGKDLLAHLKRLGPSPSPYAIMLAASKRLALEQIASYQKWHTPLEGYLYRVIMDFSKPEVKTEDTHWASSDLFDALYDKEDPIQISCIAQKLIPAKGSEVHPWALVGLETYQHLESCQTYDRLFGKGAYWKEIRGLDNVYRMEAIRCYQLGRKKTEGYAWETHGPDLIAAIKKLVLLPWLISSSFAMLKGIRSAALIRILADRLLTRLDVDSLLVRYPSLTEDDYHSIENTLHFYATSERRRVAFEIADMLFFKKAAPSVSETCSQKDTLEMSGDNEFSDCSVRAAHFILKEVLFSKENTQDEHALGENQKACFVVDRPKSKAVSKRARVESQPTEEMPFNESAAKRPKIKNSMANIG